MSPVERPSRPPSWRIWAVAALLCAGATALVVKAARLQLVLGEDLRGLAEDQYLRRLKVESPRGGVFDRDGKPLAVSVPAWSVYADPRRIEDKVHVAGALADALGEKRLAVLDKLATDKAFVWLARRVAPEVADRVRAADLPGIGLRKEMRRYYPGKEIAGQLLGLVGIDGDGRGGVEQLYDDHLVGRSRTLPALADNRGKKVALTTGLDLSLLDGDDVTLTIDAGLQHTAEQAVLDAVREHQAKAGFAILMDAKTGELLAVANVPLTNPNAAEDGTARRNRAFADAFEPGSIFKLATFAAALDAGKLSPDDDVYCEEGRFQLGKHVIRDVHKEGWLTATQVLAQSSNIGTLKVAQRVGEDAFKQALQRYGFGERPGTGLVEESAGRLPKQARWGDARLATISFGHGLAVTGLQMTRFTAAIANGGVLPKPVLLKHVESGAGDVVARPDVGAGTRVMSEHAARTLARMMKAVTEPGGTGTPAAIPGVATAGKTGTAEKVDPITKRYSRELNLSSFVGFAPVEEPAVVALVVIDEPRGAHFGGLTAGPAWRRIVEAALLQRGLLGTDVARAAPAGTGDVEEAPAAAKSASAVAPLREAPASLEDAAPYATPGGRAQGALAGPSAGRPVADDAGPLDVVGKSAREAIRAAEQRGLVASLEGSGVVVDQKVSDGRVVFVLGEASGPAHGAGRASTSSAASTPAPSAATRKGAAP